MSYTIFLIPKAMSHLISPPLSLSLPVTFSVCFYLPGNLTKTLQTKRIFSTVILKLYPQKALTDLARLSAPFFFFSKVLSGFHEKMTIRSHNLQMTITLPKPYTVVLVFRCHIVQITRVGWCSCFYAKTVAPFSLALSLWRKRKSFCLSHRGTK